MTNRETIKWKGKSGKEYPYYIYPLESTHDAVPANYIFAKESTPNTYKAVYIGETGDISERFEDHEKWECIVNNGATHVHTHKSSSNKQERCDEESDLLAIRQTPCNKQ